LGIFDSRRTIFILRELYHILCKKLHFCIAWKIRSKP
jgi:hypothetical protein